MPYALVAARLKTLNPSVSTATIPPLRILTSLAPDRLIGDNILSVLPSLSSQYKEPTPVTRTPALITFPINKPLKPSLGCSSAGSFGHGKETSHIHSSIRRNALPSGSRKSVRFRDGDDGLVSICSFHATGRPSALLNPDSDTESDTESDDESSSSQCLVLAKAAAAAVPPLLKVTNISPIPSPHTPPYPCIYLESLSPLADARPPLLRGIVRVRNIAYEKRVAARFTIDDWTTVSEVLARYTGPAGAHGDDSTWDRFAFSISLEFYGPRPRPSRVFSRASTDSHSHSHAFTLLLAVRFSIPGVGEWWDNNGDNDFRIVLASAGSKTPGVGSTPTAEFPCRPQGVTCSADVQAAMHTLIPKSVCGDELMMCM
ncbi:putative phosphatase regulatory subunit-domain-containing protein [Russula ochroleuca]|jgi:hypothetical protein|uniref:Phosphatase regulatory subunit-domain-containing protein n=1 Tax=Russula ochroleuca TaxID=152965 RepID=A0A9P5MPQ5_9AGAM|nr:putative phosphatase regulatory subunit-domain-containing protein [Russula ochroleuca]